MKSKLRNYYREASRNYDALRFDADEEVTNHVRWFANNGACLGMKLLDVGCGTGRYSAEFLQHGFEVEGLDHSIDQLKQAQSKGVTARLGLAEELPFSSQSFDVVSFIMMLHQLGVDQFEKSMAEAVRVLKAGGRIWIKTCSVEDLAARPFTDLFPSTLKINTNRYQPVATLVRVLELNGAQLKRRETIADHYELSGAQIIDRTAARHNTTLFLLSDEEFRSGLEKLRENYERGETYPLSHQHTLLEFEVG